MVKNTKCPKIDTCLYADDCLDTAWVVCKYKPAMCPFCNEIGFDLIGLKSHLLNGDCNIFNETENIGTVF
jgi:hypothetical protein